jgi:hypothetical protein
MTLIEIAVYAAVLGGSSPFACHLGDGGVARCSNGMFAKARSAIEVRFGTGVVVRRDGNDLTFSNGIRTSIGDDGTLQFSNGVRVRLTPEGGYAFSNGLVCRSELPTLVNCRRPPA